jgi:hypothetical protein
MLHGLFELRGNIVPEAYAGKGKPLPLRARRLSAAATRLGPVESAIPDCYTNAITRAAALVS